MAARPTNVSHQHFLDTEGIVPHAEGALHRACSYGLCRASVPSDDRAHRERPTIVGSSVTYNV
jgi:hypothetical protein